MVAHEGQSQLRDVPSNEHSQDPSWRPPARSDEVTFELDAEVGGGHEVDEKWDVFELSPKWGCELFPDIGDRRGLDFAGVAESVYTETRGVSIVPRNGDDNGLSLPGVFRPTYRPTSRRIMDVY